MTCIAETGGQSFRAELPHVARYTFPVSSISLVLAWDTPERIVAMAALLLVRFLLFIAALPRCIAAIPNAACRASIGAAIDIKACHESSANKSPPNSAHNSLRRRAGDGPKAQSLAGPSTGPGNQFGSPEGSALATSAHSPSKRPRVDLEIDPLNLGEPPSLSAGAGSSAQGREEDEVDGLMRRVRTRLNSLPPIRPPSNTIPSDAGPQAQTASDARGWGYIRRDPDGKLIRSTNKKTIDQPADPVIPPRFASIQRGTWIQSSLTYPAQGVWANMGDKWVPLTRPVTVYKQELSPDRQHLPRQLYHGLVPGHGTQAFLKGKWRSLAITPWPKKGVAYALPGTPRRQLGVRWKVEMIEPAVAAEWHGSEM